MSVILYGALNKQPIADIMTHMNIQLPSLILLRCYSLIGLLNCIRNGSSSQRIMILLVDTTRELTELLAIREELAEQRLILVLPDELQGMVSIAHQLYPRFIAYAGDGPGPVADVIAKMTAPTPV